MPTGQALQEHPQRQGSSAFFHGNVSVIAISSAIQSLGGFVGIYLPKYFVQIGGDPLALGMFTSASSLIQFFTLSMGDFLQIITAEEKPWCSLLFTVCFFHFFMRLCRTGVCLAS